MQVHITYSTSGTNTDPCTQQQPCDFQTALDKAAGNPSSDGDSTIIVAPGTYTLTSTLTYNKAGGDGKLTIEAQDPNDKPVLDGQNTRQIMNINTSGGNDLGNDITVRNLVFQNGNNTTGNGGGLYVRTNTANVTVEGCEFNNNTANGFAFGGGAYVELGGDANLNDNTFSGNTANNDGGGAYVSASGNATLTNNTFTNNSAGQDGGGAYVSVGRDVNLNDNTFDQNATDNGNGGGAYVRAGGDATLTDNTFSSNNSANTNNSVVRHLDEPPVDSYKRNVKAQI